MTTTTMMTGQQILDAAIAHNSDYPEAAAEILAGTPAIRVNVMNDDRNGWVLRAVVTVVVELVDGGIAEAAEPQVFTLRRRDGRLTREETARRASRYLGVADALVPVRYVSQGH